MVQWFFDPVLSSVTFQNNLPADAGTAASSFPLGKHFIGSYFSHMMFSFLEDWMNRVSVQIASNFAFFNLDLALSWSDVNQDW